VTYHWTIKPFAGLSLTELYELLRLRSEVFVVEQNCVFLDIDRMDAPCHHLMAWVKTAGQTGASEGGLASGVLAAGARIVPPGVIFKEPSIGRVVTSPAYRGKGIGRVLMINALKELYTLYGPLPVRIGAQQYLLDFYSSLGFVQDGEMYLEDGIPHVEMLKKRP
jgi:ElaA protein